MAERKKRTREGASKFTPEVREKVLAAIRVGVSKKTAAEYAGITYDTLHNWEVRGEKQASGEYRDFLNDMTQAAAAADVADMSLIGVAAQKDWRAAAWRLGKRHPKEYADNQKVELSGSISVLSVLEEVESRCANGGNSEN